MIYLHKLTCALDTFNQDRSFSYFNPFLPTDAGTLPLSSGRDGDGVKLFDLLIRKILIHNFTSIISNQNISR
jgi:hypothetical protein